MIKPKAIADEWNAKLEPYQPLVVGFLIASIILAIWAIFQPSATMRTAVATWFVI